MKAKLNQVLVFQQQVQKKMDRLIDRLSRTAIEQEERKFELLYDKPLSEKEKIEIKKKRSIADIKTLFTSLPPYSTVSK